jgi:predicted secreted protein
MLKGTKGTQAARRERILEQLRDERSRRVVFVAHCILNQNTRYLGGAFRPGVVSEVLESYVRQGVGICQMPCPEQRAWGGVLKRWILYFYGSKGTTTYRLRGLIVPLFLVYTRAIYRRIAARTAREIEDYVHSGFEVVGVVGIGGSPSCAVNRTLDLKRSLPVLATTPIDQLQRETFNDAAIARCLTDGQGIFIRALQRELDRRSLHVPFLEHDLIAEMHGEISPLAPIAPGIPAPKRPNPG